MSKQAGKNKELVRQFVESLNADNLASAIEFLAEDFVDHNPIGGDIEGRETYQEYANAVFQAFPDNSFTIEDIVAEGDLVAVRGIESGTHEGAFMNIDPTEREAATAVMQFFRIEDGKITERWPLVDRLDLFEQIGVLETPGR